MKIKGIIFEDTVNYKKISMTIMMPACSFKCDKEYGSTICQNCELVYSEDYEVDPEAIINNYYIDNPIVEALVFQGLEPFDSWEDLLLTIDIFRIYTDDDIIIYTGYKEEEIEDKINELKKYKNIIIKFGRYIPNQDNKYDEVLGVTLASSNQYAVKIS